jgi:hypothetical protein
MLRTSIVVCALSLIAVPAFAQTAKEETRPSVAIEADVLAYGLPGYSGIVNVSLPNGFQVAFGVGRYAVPSFLLKEDDNYDAVHWKATATSLQVFRMTYRFRGPMKNGPAVGMVVLNQHWRLRSEQLSGESRFRPLSVGITTGYYQHIGTHFYVYPTAAYTYNRVISGQASLQGTPYTVARFGPNASLHAGWEWGR